MPCLDYCKHRLSDRRKENSLKYGAGERLKRKFMARELNEKIQRSKVEESSMMRSVHRKKTNYLGHTLKRNFLLYDVIDGQINMNNFT